MTAEARDRGQHPKEATILDALYLKSDLAGAERAEQALCDILQELHDAAALVESQAQELAEAIARAERLERVLYPPDSPQREDASGEAEAGSPRRSASSSAPTDLPHLDRACELLWQVGHPAIAEALEREAGSLRQELVRAERRQKVYLDWATTRIAELEAALAETKQALDTGIPPNVRRRLAGDGGPAAEEAT